MNNYKTYEQDGISEMYSHEPNLQSPVFGVCGASHNPNSYLKNITIKIKTGPVQPNEKVPKRIISRYFGHTKYDIDVKSWGGLKVLQDKHCKPKPNCKSCPLKYLCKHYSFKGQNGSNPSFAEFFCGAGGMSLGFEQAGFSPKFVLDNDPWSLFTYKWNRPELLNKIDIYLADIRDFMPKHLENREVDLVAGGVPCQPFSNANRQRNISDSRWSLFQNFVAHAVALSPKMILIENVSGFREVAKECTSHLESFGYETKSFYLNASEYGVPQPRSRVFILALSRMDYKYPNNAFREFEDKLEDMRQPAQTLRNAIGDLPILAPNRVRNAPASESAESGFAFTWSGNPNQSIYVLGINSTPSSHALFNHKARYNNERDIKIFSLLKQGEDSRSESIMDIMPYKNRSGIFHDKYYKLPYDKACRTITAHMRYDCNSYIHPEQPRGLTVREAARVQGFPDDYVFTGTFQRLYQQVGNAVPPPFAKCIAHACQNII